MAEKRTQIPEDEWDWVERWLDAWERSEHASRLGEGYPDHSTVVGGSGFGGHKEVFEDWKEEAEELAVSIIEMMLGRDSHILMPVEKMAVLHLKKCAICHFKEPVEVIYVAARAKIGAKLQASNFF